MKKAAVLALALLLTSAAFAQGTAGPSVSRVGRGNLLPKSKYATDGTATTINYCVDSVAGVSDSNACIGTSGGGCCATVQGCLNKIPKMLRQQVVVNIGTGTYGGFYVSGFTADTGFQQTTGGLLIQGTLATSTLASGSATGTATSGTAGTTPAVFGTLTDSGASWTVNDLTGRLITTANPTNTALVIASNTATTITIVGSWSAPTGSTTYTIQDPGTVISTAINRPSAAQVASGVFAAAIVSGNDLTYRTNAITLANMQYTNTTGSASVAVDDISPVQLWQSQVRPGSSITTGVFLGLSALGPSGRMTVRNCDVALNSTAAGAVGVSVAIASGVALNNTLVRNQQTCTLCQALNVVEVPQFTLTSTQLTGFVDGIDAAAVMTSSIQSSRISCSGSAGTAIHCAASTFGIANFAATATCALTSILNDNVDTCGYGLMAIGPGSFIDTAGTLAGSVATTALVAVAGGTVLATKGTMTLTSGTIDMNLDNGLVTAAFGDITPTATLSDSFGSRIILR